MTLTGGELVAVEDQSSQEAVEELVVVGSTGVLVVQSSQ